MDEFAKPSSPSPSKLSKTPSWLMLGFLLGALFMWSLPNAVKTPTPRPTPVANKTAAPVIKRAPMTELEAVFAEWGEYAVWENDLTEIALWNDAARAHSDFFEVLRVGGVYYFRSIPRLTRPLLTRGMKVNSPLQFTEPESRRQEWLRQVAEENLHALSGARERSEIRSVPSPLAPPGESTSTPRERR